YNHLNLPTKVVFYAPNGINSPDITQGLIEYVYDAVGVKLSKIVSSSGPVITTTPTTTYYAGNYIYEETLTGEELKFFNHPEGYVEPNSLGSFDYIYQYKDHLGNIRLSYNKGSFQSLIESAFYEEYDGWGYNGGTANGYIVLESGRLKVNVTNAYNGATIEIGDSFNPGDQIDIRVDIDKDLTDKIYIVVQERNSNGNVLAIYNMNNNLLTGSHNFTHTVVAGEKLNLKIAKSNTDTNHATHFYIDNVYASTGEPDIVEENNYYPFGLKHEGYGAPTVGVDHKYGFGGKEEQDEMELNMLDFGARMYDPAIGRWHVTDNLSELYFSNSTYVYALNTPLQAIDPDGNVVIFINGNHKGEGATGYEEWRKGTSSYNFNGVSTYWRNNGRFFDDEVQLQLRDYSSPIYRDGSAGGFFGVSSDNPIGVNMAAGRIRNGFAQGNRDAKTIIANLKRDKTTGEIIETIKIITHSMGGAYGKGYVKALKKYISTLPIEQQRQIRITLVADFDPHQAGSLTADPNIHTQQYTHKNGKGRKDSDRLGWLANQRQNGLSDSNYFEDENEAAHSIFTFFNDISNLQVGTYFYDKENQTWNCTSCGND
ncbi:RHS repeat protein, partial [Xanthomarina spongicola]